MDWKLFKEYSFLSKHKGLIALLLIFSSLAAGLEGVGIAIIFPILGDATGSFIKGGPKILNLFSGFFEGMSLQSRLQIGALAILLITFLRGVCIYVNIALAARLKNIVIKDFRMRCINQMMRVGFEYFNRQRGSDFQLMIDGYTNSTTGTIVNLIATAVPMLLTIVVLLVLLTAISLPLMLIALGLVFLITLVLNKLSKNIMHFSQQVIKVSYGFNSCVFDVISGMKLIRLFGQEPVMTKVFEKRVDDFNKMDYRVTTLTGMVMPLFELLGIGVLSAILILGSFLLPREHSQASLGVLLTFIIILMRIITPMKILNNAKAAIVSKLPALNELSNFLNPEGKCYVRNGSKDFRSLTKAIEFRGVSFHYKKGLDVLRGLNFSIPKGYKLGIVGTSGSGKSTITEVLMRFYDPVEGQIMVDGINLSDIKIETWRSKIGVVAQDTFLFNDTLKANIAFADSKATDEQIIKAAQRAHIHEFIQSLPNGYDTVIGDRGILVSGGQRQRIAIARAILKEPDILILDEATSSLDTESEQTVQNTLDEITKGKTVIAIAHRLSTLVDFDKIVVLHEGMVVEEGKHEELIDRKGSYYNFVEKQSLIVR